MEIWNRNKSRGGRLKPVQNLAHFPILATKQMLAVAHSVWIWDQWRYWGAQVPAGAELSMWEEGQGRCISYFVPPRGKCCLRWRSWLSSSQDSCHFTALRIQKCPTEKCTQEPCPGNDRSCWQVSQKEVYLALKVSSSKLFFCIVSYFLTQFQKVYQKSPFGVENGLAKLKTGELMLYMV